MQEPAGDCNTPCSANKTEMCGGTYRIGVFSYSCSGPPVPPPVEPPLLVNPCIVASQPYASQPWCNYRLGINERAADAVSRMSLAEKISQLDNGAGPIASLGLPSYNWWSEASTGVASGRHTQTTKFAFPITTGMSFNRSLWELTGRQIGTEVCCLCIKRALPLRPSIPLFLCSIGIHA